MLPANRYTLLANRTSTRRRGGRPLAPQLLPFLEGREKELNALPDNSSASLLKPTGPLMGHHLGVPLPQGHHLQGMAGVDKHPQCIVQVLWGVPGAPSK